MLKLKYHLRWIIPLLLLAIIAAYFVLGPAFGVHAAGIPGTAGPDIQYNPH